MRIKLQKQMKKEFTADKKESPIVNWKAKSEMIFASWKHSYENADEMIEGIKSGLYTKENPLELKCYYVWTV